MRSKEQLLSSFLQSAAEVAAVASQGGSVADPNAHLEQEQEAAAVPSEGRGSPGSPSQRGSASRRSRSGYGGGSILDAGGSAAGGGGVGVGVGGSVAGSQQQRPQSARSKAAGGKEEGREGEAEGREDVEEEGVEVIERRGQPDNNIHNYMGPGDYKMQMKDPSRWVQPFR